MKRLIALSILCSSIAGCGNPADEPSSQATLPPAADAIDGGLAAINRENLQAHLNFLADDARKGRMSGEPGYDQAAEYVAAQFEALGLEPGGRDGWFQPVPLLTRRIDIESAAVTVHGDLGDGNLEWKKDFVMGGDPVRDETSVRAEVVYAGFGVHAPELGYSDYDDIDVNGKIVAIFGGAPATFPHNQRAFYSSGRTKRDEMVERGAVGYISMRSRTDQKRYEWEVVTLNAGVTAGMSWINLSGKAADHHPELEGSAAISEMVAPDIFELTPISFEEALDAADSGKPMSTPLGIEVTLSQKSDHTEVTSPNVIGIIRGSDPELADEYVVYSAHLDHVGIGTPVNGDDIYNGFYDNAVGVSLLIEAARAFATMDKRPRRSILIVAVTGEERGLLGSDYFAHYPTVPSNSIVANINLDMPLLLYPLADVIAFGAQHSSMQAPIEKAVAAEGFALTPDPIPEEVLFIRSDQYSFVRQGIPSVFLVPGFTSTDPGIDGQALFRDHLAKHYHRPSDDLSRPFDWDSALRFARANVRIGQEIADAAARPTWNEGDFFGDKFGKR
ncbi:MAG: M28 family peptidase [Chromatiales bacterium]|nr:M28 family peptidase [Chromatiales bacterium]MDH3893329.1 M28 family peptidase [Chromatiales bacterium]MDH3930801.1 M28 family peptidase [Chromatiales bacterium]MDH3945020.1 M28 family peptidase [Chromatiales bacterium]MDH4012529.1 M28 family peptidase [Chromatiales bacterium]